MLSNSGHLSNIPIYLTIWSQKRNITNTYIQYKRAKLRNRTQNKK